jgi:hypothetical protein
MYNFLSQMLDYLQDIVSIICKNIHSPRTGQHIPMLADRGSSLNGGLLGYNTKGLIVGSVFGECHTLQKTKFYAPTQLAILFQWQSKVFDLLHPFLPSFL